MNELNKVLTEVMSDLGKRLKEEHRLIEEIKRTKKGLVLCYSKKYPKINSMILPYFQANDHMGSKYDKIELTVEEAEKYFEFAKQMLKISKLQEKWKRKVIKSRELKQ